MNWSIQHEESIADHYDSVLSLALDKCVGWHSGREW